MSAYLEEIIAENQGCRGNVFMAFMYLTSKIRKNYPIWGAAPAKYDQERRREGTRPYIHGTKKYKVSSIKTK